MGQMKDLHLSSFPHIQSVCVIINFSEYVNPSNNLPSEFYMYPNKYSFDGIQVGEQFWCILSVVVAAVEFIGATVREKLRKLLNFVFVFAIKEQQNRREGLFECQWKQQHTEIL